MNVYKLSNKEVCDIIVRKAKSCNITINKIGIGIKGSYFIIIKATSDNEKKFGYLLIDLNNIFLGTIDEEGNILDTEANVFATGYDGAIILGSLKDEDFNKYMLVAANADAKLVYKDGVVLGG